MIASAVVSLVYAMTGSDEPDRWAKEALAGLGFMLGGILVLAVIVFVVARWVAG